MEMNKEITIKIRRMPEKELKEFKKGVWKYAFQFSINNFKTYWNITPIETIERIIETIKKEEGLL